MSKSGKKQDVRVICTIDNSQEQKGDEYLLPGSPTLNERVSKYSCLNRNHNHYGSGSAQTTIV